MRRLLCAALLLAFATLGLAQEEASPEQRSNDRTLQRYFTRFSAHEPLYFSVGWRENGNAKFQISFKYRFFEPLFRRSIADDIYLGYTQTSIWDIELESAPFRDTNYKPSVFYYKERLAEYSTERRHFGWALGLEHESNGRDGEESRSLNILFLRPTWRWGDLEKYHVTLSPKLYVYVDNLSDNPDLDDYRGYFDLHVAYGKPDSWKFAGMFRKGAKKSYGAMQVDVTYPLDRLFSGKVNAYAHFQYFNGWGESLINYDNKLDAQFRLGLMLIR